MSGRKKWAALAVVLGIALTGGAVAYAKTETSVTNNFETGVVDIHLAEFMKDEQGAEVPWESCTGALPGTYVSKIPRVTNEGADCYVRAKLDFSIDVEGLNDSFEELGEGWEKYPDGYYYCKNVLPTGKSSDIFQGIRIPENFPQELAGESFTLKIDVDAVQSVHFEPAWNQDKPWGDVEILECKETGPYTFNHVEQITPLSVTFDSKSGKLFANPDDFFKNFSQVMPGDQFKDTVLLRNNGERPLRLYFRQEAKSDNLLDKITLTIQINGKKIYQGKMGENIEELLLAEIGNGKTAEMQFEVQVPKELDNQYTLEKEAIKWFFSAVEEGESPSFGTSYKTGVRPLFLFAVLTAAICAVSMFVIQKRRSSHGK